MFRMEAGALLAAKNISKLQDLGGGLDRQHLGRLHILLVCLYSRTSCLGLQLGFIDDERKVLGSSV